MADNDNKVNETALNFDVQRLNHSFGALVEQLGILHHETNELRKSMVEIASLSPPRESFEIR